MVGCPFKFKDGFQQAEKAKLPKSSCLPHNVAATGINSEAVLDGGQNPPPSKSHTGNSTTADAKKTQTSTMLRPNAEYRP